MKEARMFAGLLARKGEARPAMRPADEDQLGWNDMGERSRPRLAFGSDFPEHGHVPAIHRQQAELARKLSIGTAEPERKIRSRAKGLNDGRKAAFTLRLDADQHLKLRMACAISGQSAQQIVLQALDAFLESVPASPAERQD